GAVLHCVPTHSGRRARSESLWHLRHPQVAHSRLLRREADPQRPGSRSGVHPDGRHRVRHLWSRAGVGHECNSAMLGPFPVVGDCVSDEECLSMAFIEEEAIRPGDLGIWHMPSLEPGEQYASKWLLEDSAGEFWLACKYFAVRYRPGFHVPVARVVLMVSGDPGSMDAELSARMACQIRELRTRP